MTLDACRGTTTGSSEMSRFDPGGRRAVGSAFGAGISIGFSAGFIDLVAMIILFLLTMFACISRFCTVVSCFGSEKPGRIAAELAGSSALG
jgi:hypothetical protein